MKEKSSTELTIQVSDQLKKFSDFSFTKSLGKHFYERKKQQQKREKICLPRENKKNKKQNKNLKFENLRIEKKKKKKKKGKKDETKKKPKQNIKKKQ